MAASGLQQEDKKVNNGVDDEEDEEDSASPTENSRAATEKSFMEQYTQVKHISDVLYWMHLWLNVMNCL